MTFTWEAGRQLKTAVKSGVTTTYTYNSSGIRTSKKVGSTTTKYTLAGTQVVKATTGSDYVLYYYDESGSPVAFRTKTGSTYANYYYVKDLQGDIVAIANSSGAKVVEYTYDAWGKVLTTTGSLAGSIGASNPYRYRGYWYDTETGLYYVSSRYYDPETGRFINADIFVSTGQGVLGCNMFAYCENNPVNRIDYNGQFWEELWEAFIEVVHQASGVFAFAGGVSQVDSPLPGPADAVAGVIAGGTLLVCLGIAAYETLTAPASATVQSRQKEKSTPISIDDTSDKTGYSYWKADLIKNQIVVTNPLTLQEACLRVAQGGDVMCKDQRSAYMIIIMNGYHNYVGPEKGCGNDYFYHYHPTRNHTGYSSIHIWYY